jgi:hypothetical protein
LPPTGWRLESRSPEAAPRVFIFARKDPR